MSKKSKIIIGIIVAVLVIGGVLAYLFVFKDSSNTGSTVKTSNQEPTDNVSVTLQEYNDFSTLNKALQSAGLTATLESAGPYTMLAPNNKAFDSLPEGTLDDLLKPENQAKLKDILNYNIIPANVVTGELTNGQLIKTLQGQEVKVELKDSEVYFIDAKGQKALVVNKDLKATNGSIQEINTVLLPQ